MVIDKEEHRAFLLQMIKQVNFPGEFLDLAYEVKKGIEKAEISPEFALHDRSGASNIGKANA